MTLYKEKDQLYLETDASGFRLGAGLLQVSDGMCFPKDEPLDNSMLWPIAFASKSASAETHYGNIQREGLGILNGLPIPTPSHRQSCYVSISKT